MTWQEALAHYYATHETLDDTNRAWLREKVLLDAPLLTELDTDSLVALFSDEKGKLNNRWLIFTLVWQIMGLILAGQEDPLEGNLRGFWYQYANSLYTQNQLYKRLAKDPDFLAYVDALHAEGRLIADNRKITEGYCQDLCEDAIQQFVIQKVFRYQGPFKFRDPHPTLKLLGDNRASIIFFVEKEGLFETYCRKYHERHGISAVASKGFPSHLSLEYFADQLHSKKIKNVALGGLVDYEPTGFGIARDYRQKFVDLGFGIKGFTILTATELFTEETLATKYRDLTKVHPGKEKQTKEWFEETGGIHGKRHGIHINHAVKSRVHKAVERWYKDQIRVLEEGSTASAAAFT